MIKSSPQSPSSPPLFLPDQPRRKRPCDRCHAIKERCRWLDENGGTKACERCSRLDRPCQTNRPVARIGRKRASPAGNRMSLRRASTGNTPSALTCVENNSTPALAASPSDSSQDVSTSSQLISIRHRNPFNAIIPPRMTLFPELNRLEIHFLDAMLHKGIQVDKYLVGPSFRDRHLQSFVDHLSAEMPHVKDAFIACASHLTGNKSLQEAAEGQRIGYKRAAAAIASLRISKIHCDGDLSMMLILGVAIVTFTLHHSGCLPVCRFILGVVKSMYDRDDSLLERLNSDGAAFLLCLLGTEIEECAINCQLPTMRIRPGSFDNLVDRFIGISAPIFTHFYDVCQVAQEAKQMRCVMNSSLHVSLEESLSGVQGALEQWSPTVPAAYLAENFTTNEVMTMIAQAKVLRFAALIILHRLRHAYGTEDSNPLAMASIILQELETLMEITGRSVPFSDLAHLVACFELKDPLARHEALAKSQRLINFSPYCRKEHQASLMAFWAVRDREDRAAIYWTDVASCIK